ncbi:YhgE/Pip domain-containing protein [Vagococcus sp. PNs007]|uniref:YhgE/Pip domain-containing protein n=1 Tax=Vagococcus proximus TaxID=2991417 RepID=A0ABT5WY71_9ENTE|nr:YhgE/Pip domain-containing protein [Vagococcus proximus]MDF0478682.1 YhgE/Pip domain-containing protein [Vagococcus proximus]
MKKRFGNVFKLYALDWKRIYKNKLTFMLILALMVIPSLYAWFNIAALWDPYSNTKDISIAVYSDDKTAEVMGKEINIGDKIIDGLKDNDKVGWRFVDSKKELDKGVKSGKFYGGVYLPENFSENLVSFVSGDMKKPKIVYSVNQKINAIAPKIADKGASGIQDQITTQFIGTVSEGLVKGLNEVGFNLDSNFLAIDKISNKILEFDDNMDKIDEYTQEVIDLNKKMPELKDKLAKANEMTDYMPDLNKLGDKIIEVNKMMPTIKENGKVILEVQAKIPEIQNAGRQLNEIDNDFGKVEETMTKGIASAKEGMAVIQQVQSILPEVSDLANSSNALLTSLSNNSEKWPQDFENISNTVVQSLNLVQVTVETARTGLKALEHVKIDETNKDQIADALKNSTDTLKTQVGILEHIANILKVLQEDLLHTNQFDSRIAKLEALGEKLIGAGGTLEGLEKGVRDGTITGDGLQQRLAAVQSVLGEINQGISTFLSRDIGGEISEAITKVIKVIQDGKTVTGEVIDKDVIGGVSKLLSSTTDTISGAVELLEKYQNELPAMKQELHSANELLNGNMGMIIDGINKAVEVYQEDLPVIEDKMNLASKFIQNDLPKVEDDLVEKLDLANEKMPEVESALNMAQDMIEKDWPNVKKGIHKAAEVIRTGRKDIDITEVMKLLKADAAKESDFLANPVLIDQHDVYPVPNNGSASAPFYTALCLWVGAVLFSSIATTEFHLSDEDKKKYSRREQFLARMMTFLTVGFFQSLIVALGNLYLLGTYAVSPGFSILFALLVGFVFMIMVYVLVALFGNLGKGGAVIILVLSISGGGGNYPIEMSGKFFQFINPLLPFTHAVNLLREPVGGIYWPNASKALTILIGFGVAFFVFGVIFFPPVQAFFKKLNNNLKEGHILH